MPGKGFVCHKSGKDVAIVTYGTLVNNAMEAEKQLTDMGISASVFRLAQLNPLPKKDLADALNGYGTIVIVEEACRNSGLTEAISHALREISPESRVFGMDLGENFVPHGNVQTLYQYLNLDGKSIAEHIKEVLSK